MSGAWDVSAAATISAMATSRYGLL
jgi:hypothetical protein